ncbi:MAG TPA: formylglycine-generating enzyme family protein [Opitutaceae bacterium]|jgi:formylglycine-generating enzyme required for sulfatase activity
MRFLIFLLLAGVAAGAGAPAALGDLVWVEGGVFRNTKSKYFGKIVTNIPYPTRPVTITGFYMGRSVVTQKQWTDVMGDNPSKFRGDNLPVETVSWYDCIEYCNRRSRREGLPPCYQIDRSAKDPGNRNEIDTIKWIVTRNVGANGYRLPTEAEWEYAADGGQRSRSFTYSGSNDADHVAWYWENSGDKRLGGFWSWGAVEGNHDRTHPVGSKPPNELGLYGMSGNVREWCWNWYGDTPSIGAEPEESAAGRVWRGGGWMGGDFCCATTWRAGFEASGKGADQGFRICRDP